MKHAKRHPLIFGTLILTITGLITRIIGFFYRIYLSRLFGEEGMGIYQLLSPALSLSFSLTAAGYQTAISKFVAANTAGRRSDDLKTLLTGASITLPLSLGVNAVLFLAAEPIGIFLLKEARTISMLRILSFSIPFAALHACINGYFYGKKKASVPALTQLLEQLARVGCVFLVTGADLSEGRTPSINAAVLGLTVGELLSMLIALICLYIHLYPDASVLSLQNICPSSAVYRDLLGMALPLTANRIVLNILQSIEAVSIPQKLLLYGYDTTTALSVYGVLTGMAMPMIFFPNALTSSVAVLLLPTISENHAKGDREAVWNDTLRTVKYCSLMGFLCLCGFLFLGDWMGTELFHSELAGHFIVTLGFICPFLYLDTTLSSILQGLGMAGLQRGLSSDPAPVRIFCHSRDRYAGISVGDSGQPAGTCRNLFFLSVPFLPPKHSFLNLSHKNTSLSNLCRADGGVLFRKYRSPVLILIVILIVENTLQLIHEGIHILEFSVDRSKSHISDRIQIL